MFAIVEPGNPLMTQALDAMKRYYEAQQAKLPDDEIERIRLEAEALFRAVRISTADARAPLRHAALTKCER